LKSNQPTSDKIVWLREAQNKTPTACICRWGFCLQTTRLLQAVGWSVARLGILGILGILLLAYDEQSAPHQIKTSILSIRSIPSNHSQRRTLKPARHRWYLNRCCPQATMVLFFYALMRM
jgi:hypothetical protein